MGKKRKRGQTKQNWTFTTSRKLKKRQKTRGYGFKQAKVPNEVHESQFKLSNTMNCHMHELSPCENPRSSSSVCNFTSLSNAKLHVCGISAIFSRLNTCANLFQRYALGCFKSIRNVFLLLHWLKQVFGCGLHTLGKFLRAEKYQLAPTDRATQFEEMVKRVDNLEEEVKSLKSELVKKSTCSCGSIPSSGSSLQEGYVQPSLLLRKQPPPPPPPPPPPVLPPPPPPLAFLKNKQTTPQATDSKENKNKTSRTLVTLEDLKKVKLRKVTQVIEKDKENTAPESETTRFKLQWLPRKPLLNKLNQRDDVQCVVSLREIKNVTLKRTKTETEMEKINLRTPEEMVVMRQNLRKVNITRSPGGTPLLSGKSCEHGTGLTPMMTRALRRKFQHAHPYSSPDSPKGKHKRQSLSPMDVSPNTPSPLLIR